jgi:hypothetical protein
MLASTILPSTVVHAATETKAGQLTTTARVLPAQYIVIDELGTIVEILSNTTEDVTPRVYQKSVAKDNERPLTPELYQQYRFHVPVGSSRVGVLYRRSILEQSFQIEPDLSVLLPRNSHLALSVKL